MITRNIAQSLFPDKNFSTHVTSADDEHKHSHEYFEIVYIISGRITSVCGGETTEFRKGMMILLRPGDVRDLGKCSHRDIMINVPQFRKICDFLRVGVYEDVVAADRCLYCNISDYQINLI